MNNKIILIVAGFVLLSVGTGYWLQNKKVNLQPSVNLYVQKYTSDPLESESALIDLAKIIGANSMNIVIHLYEKDLKELINGPIGPQVDVGIFNAFQVLHADKNGDKLDTLYSVSPDPFSECFIELKVVAQKGSSIESVADLHKKRVALHSPSAKVAFMLNPELKRNKVIFDEVIMNQSQDWITENLRNKKIDAAISFQYIFKGSKQNRENFIKSFGGRKKNHMKLIALTDSKIPCKLLFINKKLDTNLKNAFIKNFTEAIEYSENYLYFKDIAHAGSITKINPQNLMNVKKTISEMSKYTLKDFSKKITEKDL